jgi:hypothetical protein
MTTETKPWGITADELLRMPKPEKWDHKTAKWRLEDHCRALVQEGHSRTDTLKYLIEYNSLGAQVPQWFENRLPDLVRMHEASFRAHDHEEGLINQCTPPDPEAWGELLHSYDEVINTPPLKFAIHGWLQTEGITMYGGLPGHGKTFLGLSTAKALLTGMPLFGYSYFSVERSNRVLYLCPEVGLGPLKHRLKLFNLLPFIESGELFVRSLSAPEVPLMDKRILKAAEGADVFLDTAVRFMEGEENSATEQRVFAKNLFTLLSAGARTVVGLHHSPKFSKAETMNLENALRGTNELGAMLSTAWGTKLVDQETTRLYVQNLKPRDFDPVGAFTLEGRPYIDQTGDFKMVDQPGAAGELKDYQPTKGLIDPDVAKEITRLHASGKSVREIAADVRLSKSVVGRFVKDRVTGVPG